MGGRGQDAVVEQLSADLERTQEPTRRPAPAWRHAGLADPLLPLAGRCSFLLSHRLNGRWLR
jgi:hypothetical protein